MTPGPWLYLDIGTIETETGTVIAECVSEENGEAIAALPDLLASVGPSEGGTASFPDELKTIADIVDRYDAGSGLGRHLRERAAAICAALAKATEPTHAPA